MQQPLFENLPVKVRKLTKREINALMERCFGNLEYYHEPEIRKFAKEIQRAMLNVEKTTD
jgi:hypothetical protein